MRFFFRKLFLGESFNDQPLQPGALEAHKRNLKIVWNNEKHNDIGVERLFRLLIMTILYLFPGLYVREFFGRRSVDAKNLAVESYVILKTIFPFVALKMHLVHQHWVLGITGYFFLETIMYISSLIFVSDVYPRPRSIRRSIFLLLFNYVEIVLDFAVVYAGLDLLKGKALSVLDYVYFSMITSATVGYGDISPTTNLGKIMSGFQSIIFLSFIVLILNFFGSKVDDIGYADSNNPSGDE